MKVAINLERGTDFFGGVIACLHKLILYKCKEENGHMGCCNFLVHFKLLQQQMIGADTNHGSKYFFY